MMLLAMLPAGLVTLVGAGLAAVLAYDRSGGVGGFDDTAGSALLAAALFTFAVFVGAGLFASAEGRVIADRLTELSRVARQAQADLAEATERLKQRKPPSGPVAAAPRPSGRAVALTQPTVEVAVAKTKRGTDVAARTRQNANGPAEPVEVFVNLARRLQSLVHREIGLLDELENQVEDPELLKGLFQVDHLATRGRRYAENLAVLGGAPSHRQWTRPVSVSDVLRSAVAEIEHYSRVKLVPPVPGTVRGHAVVDVVHLLAELVENATVFSAPQTRVLLRVEPVTAGLAIEVEDRGLGMTGAQRARMNALLASPDQAVLGEMLQDGRIGLYVVSVLARRHNITVQLQGNIYGGTQAVLVLPPDVLGQPTEAPEPEAAAVVVEPPPGTPIPAPPRPPAGTPVRSAPRQEAPVVGGTAVPQSIPAVSAASGATRPSLPKRRRQVSFDPEPQELDRDAAPIEDVEHDPRLMAAFRSGIRMAEDADEAGTSPAPGEAGRPGPTH